jgi:hypothetical protein
LKIAVDEFPGHKIPKMETGNHSLDTALRTKEIPVCARNGDREQFQWGFHSGKWKIALMFSHFPSAGLRRGRTGLRVHLRHSSPSFPIQ